MKLLFAGDSITDCNHLWDSIPLGDGYVSMIADKLLKQNSQIEVLNRGYNGYRCIDLLRRWDEICLKERPDYVTILVGINEVGSAMEGMKEDVDCFYTNYEKLIAKTKAKIILMEPFLFTKPAYLLTWKRYFDTICKDVTRLSKEYQLPLIYLQKPLTEMASKVGEDNITTDGIHLTALGHELVATKWLENFKKMEESRCY
jgi:lysophospholipase L1-like esterase